MEMQRVGGGMGTPRGHTVQSGRSRGAGMEAWLHLHLKGEQRKRSSWKIPAKGSQGKDNIGCKCVRLPGTE